MIEVSLRIGQILESRNMTQEELADKLGVSRRSVGKWVRNESFPRLDNLINAASVLGCAVHDLFVIDADLDYEDPAKSELTDCYDACTPERKEKLLDAARDARALSKERR